MKLPNSEYELDYIEALRKRGFIIDPEKKDGNNEFSVRQFVRHRGGEEIGLLNGIFIIRPEDGSKARAGSVQWFGDTGNQYSPLDELEPAKWHEHMINEHGFGQMPWHQFLWIIAMSLGGSILVSAVLQQWWWMLLALLPLSWVVIGTYGNFKRTTV